MRIDRRTAVLALLAFALACARPAFGQALLDDFFVAVANDRGSQVRELVARGIDANSVDRNGDPAIVVAARGGNPSSVEALLAAGAKPDQRNKFGDTALMLAALNGHERIARMLRARGAEVRMAGWTPLSYAATGGHDAIVRWLLDEGSEINAASPNGTTPLMMAVRENRYSTAVAADRPRRQRQPAQRERRHRVAVGQGRERQRAGRAPHAGGRTGVGSPRSARARFPQGVERRAAPSGRPCGRGTARPTVGCGVRGRRSSARRPSPPANDASGADGGSRGAAQLASIDAGARRAGVPRRTGQRAGASRQLRRRDNPGSTPTRRRAPLKCLRQ